VTGSRVTVLEGVKGIADRQAGMRVEGAGAQQTTASIAARLVQGESGEHGDQE